MGLLYRNLILLYKKTTLPLLKKLGYAYTKPLIMKNPKDYLLKSDYAIDALGVNYFTELLDKRTAYLEAARELGVYGILVHIAITAQNIGRFFYL